MSWQGYWKRERGFTLVEVMTAIIIMGIVFAIASSTWFRVIESRRVDSATNQMVSELRRAHTSSINRLQDWKVDPQMNSRNYRVGPCSDPGVCAAALPITSERNLEAGTQIRPSGAGTVQRVVFEPNGEALITGAGCIRIAADDGAPWRDIEINELTSRIRIVTDAPCD